MDIIEEIAKRTRENILKDRKLWKRMAREFNLMNVCEQSCYSSIQEFDKEPSKFGKLSIEERVYTANAWSKPNGPGYTTGLWMYRPTKSQDGLIVGARFPFPLPAGFLYDQLKGKILLKRENPDDCERLYAYRIIPQGNKGIKFYSTDAETDYDVMKCAKVFLDIGNLTRDHVKKELNKQINDEMNSCTNTKKIDWTHSLDWVANFS